jgi:APA family basic amino acid/polyamine antiporter
MVVGIIVGASIFVQPAEVNRHVPSLAGILAVWLVAGLLTFFGALVCAELSAALPRTGGVYVFLTESLSPACGFLWGWAMFWSVHSGIIAASAVIFARFIGAFVPLGEPATRAVAIAGILALSWINYLGVRTGSLVQTAVTAAKVAAIAVLLGVVFVSAAPAVPPPAGLPEFHFRDFVLAVSAALYAFGGWHMVAYAAGETRRPERTIPRALILGILTVTVCYVALNAAYLRLLPLPQAIASPRVAADAAFVLAGSRGAALVSALVILSSLGVLNGVILSGGRIYFAMAGEGLAFRWLGQLHPRFHSPHRALLVQALWAAVLVATGTYRALFTRVIYTEWLFFALMAIGLVRLRRRPGYNPAFRAWGYPFVPLVFCAAALLVALIQIAADPWQSAGGLLLVALGYPVYRLWMRARRPCPESEPPLHAGD